MLSTKLKQSDLNTMDSFQNGGQQSMNAEHGSFTQGMEGSYMNPEMNNYGPNPGEQGIGPEGYGRMNDGMAHGQMSQYNSYNRPSYPGMDNNMGGEYGNHNSTYGQYQQSGNRGSYSGGPRPPMGAVRPGTGSHGGSMMPGPGGYNTSQQRMAMSGQSISQQSGPTPTLNQLLQTPNSQPRYQNNFDSYQGPQKGPDMNVTNGPYGMPPGWMQSQRGMGNYPQMSMTGSSPYRGQVKTFISLFTSSIGFSN